VARIDAVVRLRRRPEEAVESLKYTSRPLLYNFQMAR